MVNNIPILPIGNYGYNPMFGAGIYQRDLLGISGNTLGNIPFWNVLPMMSSNWGGHFQVTPYETYDPSTLQIMFSPIAAQMTGTYGFGGIYGSGMNTNFDSTAAYEQGKKEGEKIVKDIAKSVVASSANTLEGTLKKIESKLADETLTNEQKAKLNDVKTKIDAKKQEVEASAKEIADNDDLDAQECRKNAYNQLDEVMGIFKEATKVLNEINEEQAKAKKEAEAAARESDGTDAEEGAEGTGTGAQGAEGTGTGTAAQGAEGTGTGAAAEGAGEGN